MSNPKCSVIVPVFNDSQALLGLLELLQPLRGQGHEVLVVDGGSDDDPQHVVHGRVDQFLKSCPGRSTQMNRAAEKASGDILWFLHADSQLDVDQCLEVVLALQNSANAWGRFDVRLSATGWQFRMVENMMNIRSRLTGIATGDQGMFVRRQAFFQVGGFDEIPLMEDIEMSRSLKKISRPFNSRQIITTSSRRWESRGVFRTILLMWGLRLAYLFGVPADRLAAYYRPCSSPIQK